MREISNMEFVGIVDDDIILKFPNTSIMESFPYKGRTFTSNYNTLLSFEVYNKEHYILQHSQDEITIQYVILNEEDCQVLLTKNVLNIMQGNAFDI